MQEEHNKPGRPRDESAAEAIKQAALQLVRKHGYRNVTIAAIAQKAGVARQTLYNRWPTKADLILDAVFEEAGRHVAQPASTPDIPCAVQLEKFLAAIFSHLAADGDTLRSLIAAAQEDDDFRAAFRERFVTPREAMVTQILAEAQQRGELPPEADPAILSAMIHGAFWYRMLNGQELENHLARAIAQAVFR